MAFYWLDENGAYYGTATDIDPTSRPTHTPVPMRPNKTDQWVNGVWVPSPPPSIQELEAEVQEVADRILKNNERDVAMAMATVDLVIAARDGQLSGLTRAQIRSAYRDRVVFYLRNRRGI